MDVKSKIYIAGHGGMVGSHLVDELIRRNYKTIITKPSKDLDLRNQKKVSYGYQDKRAGDSKIFIAPSTSGAANGFWDLNIWKLLASL